ncbi:MAG: OmpA family protein [Pseudomonadota bacterium]
MSRMTQTLFRIMALAALVLAAACSTPARFGTPDDGAAGAAAPVDQVDPASDPTSPTFFSQTIGDRVFFAVDQSNLSSEAQSVLAEQAQWLLTNTDYQAIIEGHADEQGTTEYNIALSARRANAVREYLIGQGIAGTRMRTLPLGKERPAELCAEERCYSANRRAVTIISTGAVS